MLTIPGETVLLVSKGDAPAEFRPGGGQELRGRVHVYRGRVYGTGAALAVLLDRLGADWRSALEQGQWFDEILARVLDFDPESADSRAEEAITRFRSRP